ncbi:MAG: glycosyltransferase family 4 protein [Rhizobiales bacterium]|nr:glycosyltransferase family 4 protein [Hyphomicrobiales bacterium]
MEALARELGLDGRVRLPGVTEKHGAWIGMAGLFVLSSRHEGMPNVLLEAMAAGLPVVAFDCPFGPGEMIDHGENGLLVPPEDVAALSRSLAVLMASDDERMRLGRNAESTAECYRLETIMRQWSNLLDTVDAGNPPGASGASIALGERSG